jgi:hypothetical protein
MSAIERVERCSNPTELPRGLVCAYEFVCTSCGDLVHIGEMDCSPAFGLPVGAVFRLLWGSPPICTDCKLKRHGEAAQEAI